MNLTDIKPGVYLSNELLTVPIKYIETFHGIDHERGMLYATHCFNYLPPIAVTCCPEGIIIQDGHHRLFAHIYNGKESIRAKVSGRVPDFAVLDALREKMDA